MLTREEIIQHAASHTLTFRSYSVEAVFFDRNTPFSGAVISYDGNGLVDVDFFTKVNQNGFGVAKNV